MPKPILTTKLYIPSPRPSVVLRSRLTERLNASYHRKLTLISAPAGFGKTTLLSAWAVVCNQPVAWLSLDEEHNDPTRFLVYFVAALRTLDLNVYPKSSVVVPPRPTEGLKLQPLFEHAPNYVEGAPQLGESVLGALHLPQPPPLTALLTTLLNELTTVSQNFILVLDDYHCVESQVVNQALIFILEHMPPLMHLVIATREVPPLPLARFRARDQVTELRAQDLRFTQVEATEFLNQVMDLNLSIADIAALESRTEGWITGLQLAAISLQGHQDATDFIQSFSGSHTFVLDYLVEEVLQQQPEPIRKFLLCTSILERLCGSLCDAVLPQSSPSGQEMLEYLERANLLLVPLDDKRAWYRYHHLFAEALQARLTREHPDSVKELHLRACGWYERHNLRSAAIQHALAGQDFERAAELIEQEWSANSGTYFQNAVWTGWVQRLPDALIRSRLTLSLGFAWALLFSGDLQAAADRLRDANRLLELTTNGNGSLQALLAIAWAFHAQAIGENASTIKHAHQAITCLSEEDPYISGLASSLLGLAYWTNGDLDDAIKYMSDATVRLRMAGHFLYAISGTYVLASIKIAQGHLFDAVNTYKEALHFVATLGEPPLLGTADLHLGLSRLYREQGKVEDAREHLLKGESLGEQAALPEWPYGLYLTQAQFKVDQGEFDEALHYLEEAEKLYRGGPVPNIRPVAALKTQIWLRQGRLAEALHWVRSRGLSVEDDISYLYEFEHTILARALIACYEIDRAEQAIREAVALLVRLLKAAEEGGSKSSMIEILVLQALAYKVQGNTALALLSLERSLSLAEPEGYVRIYIDEGMPMAELLRTAATQGIMPDYTGKLLAAFDVERQQHSGQTASPHTQPLVPHPEPLSEPLSKRELEILSLIAADKKNQEIANQLFISLNTVRYHTKNLYGKLGVNKRTQAVAKAQELNLI
ncbi:MAG: LuxR C-terminal-related transcriptional regulator [Chloroflexota bacterium]